MNPPRLALRSIRNAFQLLGPEACVWCHTRQFLDRPTRRSAAGRPGKAQSTRDREFGARRRLEAAVLPRGKDSTISPEEAAQQAAQRYAQVIAQALDSASAQGMIPMTAREAEILIWDYRKCNLSTLQERMHSL